MYRFFRSKIPDTAEDLAQATFLACVEGRERFRGDSTFKAYLLGIARYQLLYHFRKRRRDFDVMEMGHKSVADLGKSPSRLVAESEEQAILFEALQQIPVDYQIALELYYWEDMTQGEVASVLGVKEGTAKSRLNHARELVREKLRTMKIPEQLRQSTLAQIDRIQRDLGHTMGVKRG